MIHCWYFCITHTTVGRHYIAFFPWVCRPHKQME